VGGGSGFGFRLKAGAKLCAGGARGHLHRQRYRCCRPRNRSRIEAPAVPLPRSPSQDGVEVLGEETGWSLLVTSPHVLLGFFFLAKDPPLARRLPPCMPAPGPSPSCLSSFLAKKSSAGSSSSCTSLSNEVPASSAASPGAAVSYSDEAALASDPPSPGSWISDSASWA